MGETQDLRNARLNAQALASIEEAREKAAKNGRVVFGLVDWLAAFVGNPSDVWRTAFRGGDRPANARLAEIYLNYVPSGDEVSVPPEGADLTSVINLAMHATDGVVTRNHLLWWALGGNYSIDYDSSFVKMLVEAGANVPALKTFVDAGIKSGLGAE